MEYNYKNFGNVIQSLRKKMGVSQFEVSEAIGMSLSHYSSIENGCANPSIDKIVKICNYFHLPIYGYLETEADYLKIPIEAKQAFKNISDSQIALILDHLAQLINSMEDL